MAEGWQTLTKLTGGAAIEVERVRIQDSGIAIEGRFELPPLAIRLTGSRVDGVLPGYAGRFVSRATLTSMSFMTARAADDSTAPRSHQPHPAHVTLCTFTRFVEPGWFTATPAENTSKPV